MTNAATCPPMPGSARTWEAPTGRKRTPRHVLPRTHAACSPGCPESATYSCPLDSHTTRLYTGKARLATLAMLSGAEEVRTYESAQMVSSLVLLPVMTVLIGLAFAMRQWGAMPLVLTVVGLIALAVVLILLAAATWRREEMMARR